MSVKEYEIFPKNIQSGGSLGFSLNKLLRILKIFQSLVSNKSFDDNLNLFDKDGQPNTNANIAELLELTQTKQDRVVGLDDFVYQLSRANIDLNLISNTNIKERLRASRENNPVNLQQVIIDDQPINQDVSSPTQLEPIPSSSNNIQVGNTLANISNNETPNDTTIRDIQSPRESCEQHHVSRHSDCSWFVDDVNINNQQNQYNNAHDFTNKTQNDLISKKRKYTKRKLPYKIKRKQSDKITSQNKVKHSSNLTESIQNELVSKKRKYAKRKSPYQIKRKYNLRGKVDEDHSDTDVINEWRTLNDE